MLRSFPYSTTSFAHECSPSAIGGGLHSYFAKPAIVSPDRLVTSSRRSPEEHPLRRPEVSAPCLF